MKRSRELLRGALMFLVLITLVISFVGLGVQDESSQSNEDFVIVYDCGEFEPGTGLFFPKVCGFSPQEGPLGEISDIEEFSSIANDGNAAFFCTSNLPGSGDLRSVCSQMLGSDDVKVHLIEEIDVRTISDIQINDSGLILAICQTYFAEPPQFCTIDTSTSEFQFVTEFDGSEDFELHTNFGAELMVNNRGQAFHYCDSKLDSSGFFRACTFSLETGATLVLDLDFFPSDPVFLDSGVILAICSISEGNVSIPHLCTFNFDGSNFRFVNESFDGLEIQHDIDVNEAGQIAFVCRTVGTSINPIASTTQLCVINLDGTGFAKLTATESRVENLHITEAGEIIYQCTDGGESAFCMMNFDGSGYQVLLIGAGFIYDVIPAF